MTQIVLNSSVVWEISLASIFLALFTTSFFYFCFERRTEIVLPPKKKINYNRYLYPIYPILATIQYFRRRTLCHHNTPAFSADQIRVGCGGGERSRRLFLSSLLLCSRCCWQSKSPSDSTRARLLGCTCGMATTAITADFQSFFGRSVCRTWRATCHTSRSWLSLKMHRLCLWLQTIPTSCSRHNISFRQDIMCARCSLTQAASSIPLNTDATSTSCCCAAPRVREFQGKFLS